MYAVKIYNNGVENFIHYPTAIKEAPHLLAAKYRGKLSQPDELDFTIPYTNEGWGKVNGLTTKVKVINTKDNSVLFSGRVMPYQDNMNSAGIFSGQTKCVGALDYLNDTHTRRWSYVNKTPQYILQDWLDKHNVKVDSSRQIQLGIVEITQPVTIDTNYETTLNAIVTKLHNVLGGDIRVQERNGLLYLDYLTDLGENNNVEIRLGYNMESITRDYDPTDVITRAIILGYGEGINQLTITSVNNGVDYIEDSQAVNSYGVIEGVITNKDIQDAGTLKTWGQTALNEKKQPRLTLDTKMKDLSVLPGYELDKYSLGDTLHTVNSVLNIDVYARVIETEIDIIQPNKRDNVISTRPIRLTDQIIDLKQRNQTLENAPQGSTCIFAYPKAENIDSTHPMEIDLDIPEETININRVYLHIHGRKFRANSKDTAAGGGTTQTSSSGGGSTETSSSGGGQTVQTTSTNIFTGDSIGTLDEFGNPIMDNVWTSGNQQVQKHAHPYDKNHTHTIDSHEHTVDVPDHTHTTDIPEHIHEQDYGIYEGTYPKNVRIKINGEDLNVNYGDGENIFDEYNIDITAKVSKGNNKIQITTEQNGRIDAVAYSQIFIQSK